MAFAEGETAKVRKYAKMAKERVFCDGPPYCYKKALDEAEEKLKGKSDKWFKKMAGSLPTACRDLREDVSSGVVLELLME